MGTDLEVETTILTTALDGSDGQCTVTARKLLDICRALPDNAKLEFSAEASKLKIKSGQSRFSLQTLPAADFPRLETENWEERVHLEQSALRNLFDKTAFSMAQQDVRYFLNGLLLEITDSHLRAVATDGHRMAMCTVGQNVSGVDRIQAIVPRKGVIELGRLLNDSSAEVEQSLGRLLYPSDAAHPSLGV